MLAALAAQTADIAAAGSDLILRSTLIGDASVVELFGATLRHYGVGVVRGVIPPADAKA